jgi:hypothetical protein
MVAMNVVGYCECLCLLSMGVFSNQSANIKLIDFGSACMEHNTVYTYIQVLFF